MGKGRSGASTHMEQIMSETIQSRSQAEVTPGTAREQLEQLYRAIGIQAVAAAAAQVAKTEPKVERREHELPAFLREDRNAA
jgi:hypothetical protein